MDTVILSVAVLALILAVLALVACGTLLGRCNELNAAVLQLRGRRGAARSMLSDRVTVVLVTEPGCFGCAERLGDLAEQVRTSSPEGPRYRVLHAGEPDDGMIPAGVEVVADRPLLADLAVGIHPSVVVFGPDGIELARSVVGNRESFDSIVTWAGDRNRELAVSEKESLRS